MALLEVVLLGIVILACGAAYARFEATYGAPSTKSGAEQGGGGYGSRESVSESVLDENARDVFSPAVDEIGGGTGLSPDGHVGVGTSDEGEEEEGDEQFGESAEEDASHHRWDATQLDETDDSHHEWEVDESDQFGVTWNTDDDAEDEDAGSVDDFVSDYQTDSDNTEF